jgi:hypothetical protein
MHEALGRLEHDVYVLEQEGESKEDVPLPVETDLEEIESASYPPPPQRRKARRRTLTSTSILVLVVAPSTLGSTPTYLLTSYRGRVMTFTCKMGRRN